MVTDRERAARLIARLHIGTNSREYVLANQGAFQREIDAIEKALEAVRKERDDLWRKKVVELQKINAEVK